MSKLIYINSIRKYLRSVFQATANPSLIVVLIFSLVLIFISLLNYDRFAFSNFNFFTFVWTYILLLCIHSILNLQYIRITIFERKFNNIFKMLRFITVQYFPYLIIAMIYDNLSLFIQLFNDRFGNIDILLMQIDEWLFAVQPTVWLEQWLQPAAVDFFMLAYGMFFIYPFFYLIYLLQKNHIQLFQRVMLAQIIALISSFVSFIIFPARGPRFTIRHISEISPDKLNLYTKKLEGISWPVLNSWTGYDSFYAIQYDLWNYIERVTTDCMPSMHTGLCLICLIYALRFRKIFTHQKIAVWFWITGVTALVISTVYLRYHWVVDVIAGAILALIVYLSTELLWQNWIKNRSESAKREINLPWITAADKKRDQ